jgi:hypothetical protein
VDDRLIRTLQVIEKHLDKNEKWFQYPEKKMHAINASIQAWDKEFKQGIATFEKIMDEFAKIME